MSDIGSKILKFHAQLDGDDNHRYKSWEHCYTYFNKESAELARIIHEAENAKGLQRGTKPLRHER